MKLPSKSKKTILAFETTQTGPSTLRSLMNASDLKRRLTRRNSGSSGTFVLFCLVLLLVVFAHTCLLVVIVAAEIVLRT